MILKTENIIINIDKIDAVVKRDDTLSVVLNGFPFDVDGKDAELIEKAFREVDA